MSCTSGLSSTSLPVERLAALFGALGDVTRLRLVLALLEAPTYTDDLAQRLCVSDSAVSHQLRLLKDLRLVCSEREGRRALHRLDDDHVAALLHIGLEHVREQNARQAA